MSDTTSSRKAANLLIVIGVVLSVLAPVGLAAAASPIVDTATTNTSTTSDIVDGTTITGFDANASNQSYFEAEFDSTDPAVRLKDPETGEVLRVYGSAAFNQTHSGSQTNHYARNFSHDEFQNVPMAPGENKSVTLVAVNNSTLSTPDVTNVTVYLENVGDRSVIRVGSTVASSQKFSLKEGQFVVETLNWSFGAKQATFDRSNVKIAGQGSTLRIAFANATAASRFDDSAADAASGDAVLSTTLTAGDDPVLVYKDSAPSDLANDSTYAVYDSSEDALTVHFGSDFSGVNTTDIRVGANRGIFGALQTYQLQYVAAKAPGLSPQSMPTLFIGVELGGLTMALFGLVMRREDYERLKALLMG